MFDRCHCPKPLAPISSGGDGVRGEFQGEPASKANGRQYEILLLIRHLDEYEVRHGVA